MHHTYCKLIFKAASDCARLVSAAVFSLTLVACGGGGTDSEGGTLQDGQQSVGETVVADGKNGIYRALQLVSFPINLPANTPRRLTLTIDGDRQVRGLYSEQALSFVVPPDLEPGAHTVSADIGNTPNSFVFTVAPTAPVEDPRKFIEDFVDRTLTMMADAKATAPASVAVRLDQLRNSIITDRSELSSLSASEASNLAAFLAANFGAETFAELQSPAAGMPVASQLLLARNLPLAATIPGAETACEKSSKRFKDAVWRTSALFAVAAVMYDATLGLWNLPVKGAGTISGAISGVALALAVIELKAGLPLLPTMIRDCWQGSLDAVDENASSSSLNIPLVPPAITTNYLPATQLTLQLRNGETRSIRLRAKMRLAAPTEALVRYSQATLTPLYGLLSDLLDPLYTVEFLRIVPLDQGTAVLGGFTSVGAAMNVLFTPPTGGELSALKLQFRDPPPAMAQPFEFFIEATAEQRPVRLEVSGSLSANPPVARGSTETVTMDTPSRGLMLLAEFAESFQIRRLPAHGQVQLVDPARGLYDYVPSVGYTGSDSFTFIALNEEGSSAETTVTLSVLNNCTTTQILAGGPPGSSAECWYPDPLDSSKELRIIKRYSEDAYGAKRWELSYSSPRVFHSSIVDLYPGMTLGFIEQYNSDGQGITGGAQEGFASFQRNYIGQYQGTTGMYYEQTVCNSFDQSNRQSLRFVSLTGSLDTTVSSSSGEIIVCPTIQQVANISPLHGRDDASLTWQALYDLLETSPTR